MFCIGIAFTVSAQTINLNGKVSNSSGKPITGAIVSLVNQGIKDTTGSDGSYILSNTTPVISSKVLVPQLRDISLKNGVLEFSLPESMPIKVEIYTAEGKLLKRELQTELSSGFYRYEINKNITANLFIIRTSIGTDEYTFRYIPSMGNYSVAQSVSKDISGIQKFAKMAAVIDTVSVSANNYVSRKVAITTYDQKIDITLDSANADFHYNGNPPGPSTGCGKDLGSLKTGSYTITSSGLSRNYILDIPTNYDKNTPYRLIFGMHCYGSTMQGVANDKYYQLKRYADSTKKYCIFVAPNGTGSTTTPLWNQGEKDHAFFDDMVKLFKEKLCVDTTRIFSCGFSYGAMFSFSLSTNHQKVLRAVACYAPANWNIWLPENTHEPVAFMSTTGMSDPNCPFVYDEAKKEGGKYCSVIHAQDNGYTIPASIPTAAVGSKTHLLYEYQGGKPGYPVKLYTFDGAHQASPMDGVSGDNSVKSWVPGETWKFFMQF
jgi:poly(3-hydroxybutyrate) depolymerase